MKFYIIVLVLSVFLNELAVRLFKIEKQWLKQLLPSVICLVCFLPAWIFNIGVFGNNGIFWIVLMSLSAGLSANGLIAMNFVQKMLAFVFKWLPKKE